MKTEEVSNFRDEVYYDVLSEILEERENITEADLPLIFAHPLVKNLNPAGLREFRQIISMDFYADNTGEN